MSCEPKRWRTCREIDKSLLQPRPKLRRNQVLKKSTSGCLVTMFYHTIRTKTASDKRRCIRYAMRRGRSRRVEQRDSVNRAHVCAGLIALKCLFKMAPATTPSLEQLPRARSGACNVVFISFNALVNARRRYNAESDNPVHDEE